MFRQPVVDGLYERSLTAAVRAQHALETAAVIHVDCDLYSSGCTINLTRVRGARMERNTFHRDLEQILVGLSDREKKGVMLFYGLSDGQEMSYADLGRRLNISREGARRYC